MSTFNRRLKYILHYRRTYTYNIILFAVGIGVGSFMTDLQKK